MAGDHDIHTFAISSKSFQHSFYLFSFPSLFLFHHNRREDDGGPQGNTIFELQPGIDTIEGVTIGAQKMREQSRANLHIPSALAYGDKQMGRPGGGLYVPAGADIIFDIEVFGRIDPNGPGWFMDEDVGIPRQREEL